MTTTAWAAKSPDGEIEVAIGHRAPWRSQERTVYFEGLMDQYASCGPKHLPFTPPTTRGSLITRAEAYGINLQQQFVPTLAEAGRWPAVSAGGDPNDLSAEQREWLSLRWGQVASLWARSGETR